MEYLHSQVYHFGKLFQDYQQAAAEEFLGEDEVSEFHREVTPLRLFDVPEDCEIHELPAEEVRMVPESPTVIKMSSP